MQTQEHTWSLLSGSLRPLRALQYAIRSWGKSSLSSGEVARCKKTELVIKCSLHQIADKLLQGTCSVRSCPNLLLGLAHCSCFCPSQCPMGEPYSCHITRQHTSLSFSQTCSVDKAFFYGAVVQASWLFFLCSESWPMANSYTTMVVMGASSPIHGTAQSC